MARTNGNTRAHAHGAIDALRAGVVNRFIAEHLTYGRSAEIKRLERTIRQKKEGSTQVVIGDYGVGKSHLAEVLALRLEAAGYAVARLELGASNGRAENPQGVLRSIAANVRVRIGGRRFAGSELRMLVHAMAKPGQYDRWHWDYEIRRSIHKELPGKKNAAARYDLLRQARQQRLTEGGYSYLPAVFGGIPSAMTAVNCAVREVNSAAHLLAEHGFKGLVLLFDEAERSEWAVSYYRADRARDLMLGFALGSANKETRQLKHYRNATWRGYLYHKPSLIHSVFLFTRWWGLASEIRRAVGIQAIELDPLPEAARRNLRQRIEALYQDAYKVRFALDQRALDHIGALEDYAESDRW